MRPYSWTTVTGILCKAAGVYYLIEQLPGATEKIEENLSALVAQDEVNKKLPTNLDNAYGYCRDCPRWLGNATFTADRTSIYVCECMSNNRLIICTLRLLSREEVDEILDQEM
jgi:hypothetical protein